MNRPVCLLTFVLALISTVPVSADLEIRWSSIDSGGSKSSGGSFALSGVMGQPDAMSTPLTGGSFVLNGGLLQGDFCSVALDDLMNFLADWLVTGPDLLADLDGNQGVDLFDFAAFAAAWMDTCPPHWPL